MFVKQLDQLLDALASSSSMVPDEDDKAAIRRTAQVLRGLDRPPGVVLVAGHDVDPVVEQVEDLDEMLRSVREQLNGLDDIAGTLLAEMRDRRLRITAERDDLRAEVERLTSALALAHEAGDVCVPCRAGGHEDCVAASTDVCRCFDLDHDPQAVP